MSVFTRTIEELHNSEEEPEEILEKALNLLREMDKVITKGGDFNVNVDLAQNALQFAAYAKEIETMLAEARKENAELRRMLPPETKKALMYEEKIVEEVFLIKDHDLFGFNVIK